MSSTATEIRIKAEIFERRMVPVRARLDATFRKLLSELLPKVFRRRRKSKGWRRNVRMTKAASRK